MEPPVKGIARRPSKVLSEQDYYEKVLMSILNEYVIMVPLLQTEHDVQDDKKQ